MDINILRGIATIVVMGGFLGICWWAYFYRSKESFDEAAKAPFAADPATPDSMSTTELNFSEQTQRGHKTK